MIISHSRRFVFIHLHKTAGESITEALVPHLGRGDIVLGTTTRGKLANAWFRQRHKLFKHSSARGVRAYLGEAAWSDYLTFSFVRDPAERARSLYFYYEKMVARRRAPSLGNALLHLPGMAMRDPYRWPGVRAYLETSSFSEFIRHPAFGPAVMGARPQANLLSDADGRLLVDFVGRYERLAEDFADVAARIGIDGATLGWRNPSANRGARDPVSPEDRRHLATLYRVDCDTFGYPTDEVAPEAAPETART